MLITIASLIAALVGVGAWVAGVGGSHQEPAAALIWVFGVTMLGFGLLRDLALIALHRDEEKPRAQVRMAMLCFESTVGILAVAQGLLLQVLGWTPVVEVPAGALVAWMAAAVLLAHVTRDWVFVLVKVRNHRNLIPTWRVTSWSGEGLTEEARGAQEERDVNARA